MTNVLPKETRARIEAHVHAKFVVVGAIMAASSGAIALLSILPAYVSIYLPRTALEDASRELRDLEAQAGEDRAVVARTRAIVGELAGVRAEPQAAPLIGDILAQKPASIIIENIAYRPGSPGTITLTGKTPDRRDLEAYRERLTAMQRFSSVSIPVAALVGALSGAFTITLSGNF